MDWKHKYLKYKKKYIEEKQKGGYHYVSHNDETNINFVNKQDETIIPDIDTNDLSYFDTDVGMKFDPNKNWAGIIFWGLYDSNLNKHYKSWTLPTHRNHNEVFRTGMVLLRCVEDTHNYTFNPANDNKIKINNRFVKQNKFLEKRNKSINDTWKQFRKSLGNSKKLRPHIGLFSRFFDFEVEEFGDALQKKNLHLICTGISYDKKKKWNTRSATFNQKREDGVTTRLHTQDTYVSADNKYYELYPRKNCSEPRENPEPKDECKIFSEMIKSSLQNLVARDGLCNENCQESFKNIKVSRYTPDHEKKQEDYNSNPDLLETFPITKEINKYIDTETVTNKEDPLFTNIIMNDANKGNRKALLPQYLGILTPKHNNSLKSASRKLAIRIGIDRYKVIIFAANTATMWMSKYYQKPYSMSIFYSKANGRDEFSDHFYYYDYNSRLQIDAEMGSTIRREFPVDWDVSFRNDNRIRISRMYFMRDNLDMIQNVELDDAEKSDIENEIKRMKPFNKSYVIKRYKQLERQLEQERQAEEEEEERQLPPPLQQIPEAVRQAEVRRLEQARQEAIQAEVERQEEQAIQAIQGPPLPPKLTQVRQAVQGPPLPQIPEAVRQAVQGPPLPPQPAQVRQEQAIRVPSPEKFTPEELIKFPDLFKELSENEYLINYNLNTSTELRNEFIRCIFNKQECINKVDNIPIPDVLFTLYKNRWSFRFLNDAVDEYKKIYKKYNP